MKLKLNTEDGKEKYLDVSFWSFLKCVFLTYITMAAILSVVYFFLLAFILQTIFRGG